MGQRLEVALVADGGHRDQTCEGSATGEEGTQLREDVAVIPGTSVTYIPAAALAVPASVPIGAGRGRPTVVEIAVGQRMEVTLVEDEKLREQPAMDEKGVDCRKMLWCPLVLQQLTTQQQHLQSQQVSSLVFILQLLRWQLGSAWSRRKWNATRPWLCRGEGGGMQGFSYHAKGWAVWLDMWVEVRMGWRRRVVRG